MADLELSELVARREGHESDDAIHAKALHSHIEEVPVRCRDDSENLEHESVHPVVEDQVEPYSLVRVVVPIEVGLDDLLDVTDSVDFHVEALDLLVPQGVV